MKKKFRTRIYNEPVPVEPEPIEVDLPKLATIQLAFDIAGNGDLLMSQNVFLNLLNEIRYNGEEEITQDNYINRLRALGNKIYFILHSDYNYSTFVERKLIPLNIGTFFNDADGFTSSNVTMVNNMTYSFVLGFSTLLRTFRITSPEGFAISFGNVNSGPALSLIRLFR